MFSMHVLHLSAMYMHGKKSLLIESVFGIRISSKINYSYSLFFFLIYSYSNTKNLTNIDLNLLLGSYCSRSFKRGKLMRKLLNSQNKVLNPFLLKFELFLMELNELKVPDLLKQRVFVNVVDLKLVSGEFLARRFVGV